MPKSTKCPKCSSNDLTVKWRENSNSDSSKDCLERKCNKCGYVWEDPCDDA